MMTEPNPEIVDDVDPADEPITLEKAWDHLRIDVYDESPPFSDDDEWLATFIPVAREVAEEFCGRAFAPKTVRLTLEAFPDDGEGIPLPLPPVVAVDSVVYRDASGAEVTMSGTGGDYEIDRAGVLPLLVPTAPDWPTAGSFANAVVVTYEVGYTAETLPKRALAGMLLILADLYRNREASAEKAMTEVPTGIDALLRPLRVRKGLA